MHVRVEGFNELFETWSGQSRTSRTGSYAYATTQPTQTAITKILFSTFPVVNSILPAVHFRGTPTLYSLPRGVPISSYSHMGSFLLQVAVTGQPQGNVSRNSSYPAATGEVSY